MYKVQIRAPWVISADFRSTIAVPPKVDVEANSLFQSGGTGSQIAVYLHAVPWCSSSVLVISGVRQPPKQSLTMVVVKVPV